MVEQFSAVHKRQDKIKFFCALEREFKGYDERAIDLGEDGTFGKRVGDF